MWLLLLCTLGLAQAENESYKGINWKAVEGCGETLEENYFVLGCNQKFYRCHNGHPYELECPSGLFFDPRRNRCNFKDEVRACTDEEHFRMKLIRGIKPFDCDHRTGSFEHPQSRCDKVYYTCVHGRSIRQQCRNDQVFDEAKNRCDYKENVRSCKSLNRKKISGYISPISNGYPQGQVPLPPVHSPPTGPTNRRPGAGATNEINFCQHRPDGLYSTEACSAAFMKCSAFMPYKYMCQEGLVFNTETMSCDVPERVESCKNMDCSGKVDGFYEKEHCGKQFYSCVGGEMNLLDCAAGLVYDSRISACVYPLECRSSLKEISPPVLSADHGSIPVATPAPERNSISCAQKQNGFIALQNCSPAYITCSNGIAYHMNCHDGLVFNNAGGYCDTKERCLQSYARA